MFLKHGRRGLPSYKLVYLLVEKGTGSKDVYRLYWTKSKQADAHRDRISNTERTYSSAYATSSKVILLETIDRLSWCAIDEHHGRCAFSTSVMFRRS